MSLRSARNAVGVVLLVDDDRVFRNTISRALSRRGWHVATAASCAEATDAAHVHRPTVIILGLLLADGSGLDLIARLHQEAPAARIVMTTGHPSLDTAVEAMRRGAHHYVSKPCTTAMLLGAAESPTSRPVETASSASLAQSERAYINRVIVACHGNLSQAARRLRLHRRSLQRKLRKLVPEL